MFDTTEPYLYRGKGKTEEHVVMLLDGTPNEHGRVRAQFVNQPQQPVNEVMAKRIAETVAAREIRETAERLAREVHLTITCPHCSRRKQFLLGTDIRASYYDARLELRFGCVCKPYNVTVYAEQIPDTEITFSHNGAVTTRTFADGEFVYWQEDCELCGVHQSVDWKTTIASEEHEINFYDL